MNRAVPLLSDIESTQTKYYPGDRMVARVSVDLKADQRKKVLRGVDDYTREHVNTLIVNCAEVEIIKRSRTKPPMLVAGIDFLVLSAHPNEVKLSCSRVPLCSTDLLEVALKTDDPTEIRTILDGIQRWAGEDVMVLRVPWRVS